MQMSHLSSLHPLQVLNSYSLNRDRYDLKWTMTCMPHRMELIELLGVTPQPFTLPDAKGNIPQPPEYRPNAVAKESYQGGSISTPASNYSGNTGYSGVTFINSRLEPEVFQPWKGYPIDNILSIANEPTNDKDPTIRTYKVEQLGNDYDTQPYQAIVQTNSTTSRSQHELTKLLVEERNPFLEEKADRIAKLIQPRAWQVN